MGNCMRSLFKKLRRKRSSKKTVVLLVAGLDNAGKTSVLNRISNDPSQDVLPTMGFRIVSLRHKSYFIKVYDIGGAQQIRSIWSKYYNDVHGLIYVVDASDLSRLTENKFVFGELVANEHISGKPILLLANKQDAQGAIDELDLVENLDVERVANAMRCPTRVETCSCLYSAEQSKHNTMGIINGYKWLLDTISKNFATIDNRIKESQNRTISNNRVFRRPSSSSNTLSRSSIRSNPFKPIRELLAEKGRSTPGSSNENLIDNKKKRGSLKKLLSSCKNRTTPMALEERMSKSQYALHRTGCNVLPINGQDSQNQTSLVTLDPLNLVSVDAEDHSLQRRPFTAPEMSHRHLNQFVLFNIPGQVPQ